jgi:hypothetical protein
LVHWPEASAVSYVNDGIKFGDFGQGIGWKEDGLDDGRNKSERD